MTDAAGDRPTSEHEVDDWTVFYSAPHPPRKSSPVYVRAHHQLVYVAFTPCWICGLIPNPRGGWDDPRMTNETHHQVIEDAAFMGVDIAAVEHDEPDWDWTKVDPNANATFFNAGDAAPALRVLCSVHHRATRPLPDHRGILGVGVHHIPYPIWELQRYILPQFPLFQRDDSRAFDPEMHLHPQAAENMLLATSLRRELLSTATPQRAMMDA